MNLFYCDNLTEKEGSLGKEESHHAVRVLRIQIGDKILVTEGLGEIYRAEVSQVSKTHVQFKCLDLFKQEKRKNKLHIAIAPTKSLDRFETFLEKAAEVGVDEITPIICFHSERKVYKIERGEKVIKAAAKQSLSCWLPKLNSAVTFHDFLENLQSENAHIAHCEEDLEKHNVLSKLDEMEDVLILIGPEGDFSKKEIDMALAKSVKAVSLGPKRLRTETAGMVVAIASKLL
jgi:16S rRNA (uracil1498-N3)-methyltransferase